MKVQNPKMQVDAFVDGELELADQLEMEARMRTDSVLRSQVEDARQLRALLRENADYHPAPESLRARLAAAGFADSPSAAAAATPAPRRHPVSPRNSSGVAGALQRWFGWRPLAASLGFAGILAIAVNMAWLQSARQDQLSDDVIASHVRSTLGQHLVDVSSAEKHTVKPFLSSKLGFSPPVGELDVPDSSFVGGRVDYLEGRPVAALVYKQGPHIVNSFVWPVASADTKPSLSEARGFRMAHWVERGMSHWVISDVNREEFQAVVQAVQKVGSDQ
jgi:anti-sigma factor RsiW